MWWAKKKPMRSRVGSAKACQRAAGAIVWAVVEIGGGRIQRIEAVTMNQATFQMANYISDVNADFLAEAVSGLSQAALRASNLSSVDVLRRQLD